MLSQIGSFCLGFLIGWFTYYINRYRQGSLQYSDITTIVGVFGGAALTLKLSTAEYPEYAIGLLVGFLSYFVMLLILVRMSSNFDRDWFLDGRRRRPVEPYYIPDGTTVSARPAVVVEPSVPIASSFRPPPQAEFIGPVPDTRPVRLLVVLRAAKASSVRDGRARSKSELIARYQSDPAALQKVLALAKECGLTVRQCDATGNMIELSGTYAQARRAFQPDGLGLYRKGSREFVGREGHLHVPTDLAGEIIAILGFDGRSIPVAPIRVSRAADIASENGCTPLDVAKLYKFPVGADGGGQTIGIVALGGGYTENAVNEFFSRLGIMRTGSLTPVSVDGTQNSPEMADDDTYNDRVREVHMDVEIIGSVAPGANIVVYFASYQDITGLQAALQYAVTDTKNTPSVLCVSWHYPEDIAVSSYRGALDAINQVISMARDGGITVCAASGDAGLNEDPDDPAKAVVSVPACCPYVLSCGGTSWAPGGVETFWADTGRGFSSYFNQPSYQSKIPGTSYRAIPDVAAVASPGYNIVVNGATIELGGTSAAAPLWSALIALVNQKSGHPSGFVNPTLYLNPNALAVPTDTPGDIPNVPWNPIVGLGSPNGMSITGLMAGTAS